jgi:hypothetical protein
MMPMVGAFAEFERAMLRNEPRRVWILLVGKDPSAAVLQS